MSRTGPLTRLIVAILLGGCLTAPPAQHELNVVSVSGTGRISVKPDIVLVNVGVEARAPALVDATADVSRRMTAVIARVKTLDVREQDITSIAYSVDPIFTPRRSNDDASRIVAYHVVNVVRLRIRDVTAVGHIADQAVAAGANTISALQFTLSNRARVESEARALAVREAAAKARELAAAAGVQLGDLLSINEGAAPHPIVGRPTAIAAASGGPGPVEAGQLEIVVTVEARYRVAAVR
jgi:uncharacterized protein YggE